MREGWAAQQCRAEFARGRRETKRKEQALAPERNEVSRRDVLRTWKEKAA